jgi:hypothetical protein
MRTIVETPTSAKDADSLTGETHLEAPKDKLARNPKAGDLIANTGGFYKIRGRRTGVGQRGGVRVFYYPSKRGPIYLIACIPKADDQPLTKEQCKELKSLANELDTANVAPLRRSKP